MVFQKIFLVILLCVFLYGCSNKNILYIENDNYSKFSQYYFQDIQLHLKKFKLIGGFNNQSSFEQVKEILSLINIKCFQKVNVYAIIFFPYKKDNQSTFDQLFNYINNLESFLVKEKKYTNHLHIIGIPQNNTHTYLVLIYFNKDKY